MTQVDVAALAKLARLELSAEEQAKLATEIPAILGFVEEIQKVATDAMPATPELRNVMREDVDPRPSGTYTKDLLDAAPAQRDDQIVVKQVITRKKAAGSGQ